MPDMLVSLYNLPKDNSYEHLQESLKNSHITLRRPIGPEKWLVTQWVEKFFQKYWASECEMAFSSNPPNCFIAIDEENSKMAGFACYDSTALDFFGPTGVDPDYRGKGIGKALLLRTMEAMKDSGYAYAIIGSAGPQEFYKKAIGAVAIENSENGIYKGMLRE